MRFDRTLALLWGDDSKAVGRSGLTIADFVAAATAILDERGSVGLSMRTVASRLGVRTMAAYTFGNKGDLVALVVDRAYREMYPPRRRPRRDWRRGLADIANANRALGLAHPWLTELQAVRSLMGPHEFQKRERELAPLESTPLSDVEKDQVLTQVLLHVAGMTRMETALRHEREETGLNDPQWWRAIMPTLEPVVDPQQFPLSVRVGLATQDARNGEFSGDAIFRFGLDRLLDGIGVLIEGRRPRDS
ncbi:TetR/AcrR family transcriptional regulator [Solicola gregarius]|uniref:TetR/AcrR family transcriptional regulator C-terminal domain-containing protein n=1 Tax=Solicola gregarius TaxID=2908642 RepID=A0AA46TLX1_9ACTN|nr:TetR/AcrR family transcriptional regulator C-terminal domain-containing protein [Solicola gregarius]UYM06833.1 TetR/AcrR family transcriptional regulator C-terminal domain-containing protein [Solicola gregarius]